MKKRHRRLAALVAGAMALSLTGCGMFGGKAPDPAELAARIGELDLTGYYAASIAFTASMNDGETAGTIALDASIETDGTVTHVEGLRLSIAMEGMTLAADGEWWTDMASNTSYMNMSMFGETTGWTAGTADAAGMDMSETLYGLDALAPSANSEPVLAEHRKGEPWEVSWETGASGMSGLFDGLSGFGTDDALADGIDTVTVMASFDESSHEVKTVHARATSELADISVYIEFDGIGGGKQLSVPDDVIASALENGSVNGIQDTDGTDGYSWGLSMCEDGYMTDNDGYDPVIDGLAAEAAKRTDGSFVTVMHYSDYAEMTVRYDCDEWSGEIGVRDMSGSSYSDAVTEFVNDVEFLDGWYDPGERVESSGNYAMYLRPDEMDMCYVSGSMFVSVSVYTYDDMPREAFDGYIAELVSLSGAPGRES